MIKRCNRIKHTGTFEQRFADEAARFRKAAADLPQCTQRELYMKHARQAEIAWTSANARRHSRCSR
ncbi:hypothetical protein XH93_36965 [Bradyrhizobium sp. CCBAU 51753]|nr:hypothetical protein XH93_36965 [Bradyrhizobium sp. CCBAU 51753]